MRGAARQRNSGPLRGVSRCRDPDLPGLQPHRCVFRPSPAPTYEPGGFLAGPRFPAQQGREPRADYRRPAKKPRAGQETPWLSSGGRAGPENTSMWLLVVRPWWRCPCRSHVFLMALGVVHTFGRDVGIGSNKPPRVKRHGKCWIFRLRGRSPAWERDEFPHPGQDFPAPWPDPAPRGGKSRTRAL